MRMSEICIPDNDRVTSFLTGGLIVGMIISYIPQHLRIILAGSSEGFSPWFLLLGSTSSASGMMNIIVMQWSIIKCCRVFSFGNCLESTAGIFQLALQWILFTIILVLYMIYYPPHLKYATVDVDMHDDMPPHHIKTTAKSNNWKLSIILSWVVMIHLLFITFVSFLLLTTTSAPDPTYATHQISLWATFLGVSSALLAALQYAPQIVHTYRMKLVGALSIKMMLIQSPGALFMVLSIALRPGTNWTTWIPYAVAGVMQATLLIICLSWKARQLKLGIDDFGNALFNDSSSQDGSSVTVVRGSYHDTTVSEGVRDSVDSNLRHDEGIQQIAPDNSTGEDTPLLAKDNRAPRRTWLARIFR